MGRLALPSPMRSFNQQAHKTSSTRGIEDESHRVRRHFSITRDYGTCRCHKIGSNSKMKGVLLALALPGARAMGYATDGPEGIIYTSGNAPITDPVKYCS